MRKHSMRKHILSLILILALCAALTPTAGAFMLVPETAPPRAEYTDVPEDHWAAGSIRRATELGLFQGVAQGRFGLGQPISRAAFVTALGRLFDWEAVTPEKGSYTDVARDAWYYAAVETARANSGVAAAGREFRPEEGITRSEMASMLLRSLGYTYLAGAAAEYTSPFEDVSVNRGFITLAYDLGIMSGKGSGRFDPEAAATREQAATVLVRVYNQLYKRSIALDDTAGYRMISVATPMAHEGTEMPITPLEPLTDLYAALRRMKAGGDNMEKTALRLAAGGVRTLTDQEGEITDSGSLTADQVKEILSGAGVETYYSDQYESAYCIYQPNEYQTATLWYQSAASLDAKLQLARLFGVTRYVLE